MKTLGTEGTPATERYRHHHEQVRNKSRDVVMPTAVSATEGMPSTLGTAERGWILAKAGKKTMSERLAQQGLQQ